MPYPTKQAAREAALSCLRATSVQGPMVIVPWPPGKRPTGSFSFLAKVFADDVHIPYDRDDIVFLEP